MPPAPHVDEIRHAAESVLEPELNRTLGELGLVRSVELDRKTAHIVIAHPAVGYPNRERLEASVTDAVGRLDGLKKVEIRTDVLDESEQEALRLRLLGDPASTAGSGPAQGHAEGRAIRFSDPECPTRVLLVASGKGGVGKSTVTVNLAATLAARGHRVGLIDADVWGFSVPRMVGVSRPPMVVDRMLVPPEANGVRCISMGFFAHEDQAVIWRGPMLHKALEQFLTDVWWDDPDYLLIDLPPGTGDISLSLSQFLPRSEVLLVTTPQLAAQRVAQRAGAMANKVNLQLLGVVENMAWFDAPTGDRYELFGAGGGQALAESLGVPVIGQVPLTMELREGGDIGNPIVVSDPSSTPAKAFGEIADWLAANGPRRRYRKELTII